MGRRGRKRQLEVEAEYWQLLKAGVGTVAACRLVGGGRASSGRNRERQSTDPEHGGGPSRSSAEAPVMGVERRGRVIRVRLRVNR